MKVFNIEFDGIDKSGKDSIKNQLFSIAPNKYIPKSRGLISQIAYAKLYNRDVEYEVTDGYIENTLFVLLTVDEDDWNVRCDISGERKRNEYRTDLEAELEYSSNSKVFLDTYNELVKRFGQDHFMLLNTSVLTPINIIKKVVEKIELLNKLNTKEDN